MLRALLAAAVILLPLPALATEIFLTIDNQSSQSVTINTYPVDSNGDPVEDNIGAYSDILAGTKGKYRLDSRRCELVLVTVIMADSTELQTKIDLCKRQALVISD